MPMYEFRCTRCAKEFEEVVSTSDSKPACPECDKSDAIERVPFGKVSVGRKEDLRPRNIKGTTPPRRRS
jgi:putative FmdB family regulatory protein